MRIAFDVGGVLSKHPDIFGPLLKALHAAEGIEVWIVSDMHPVQKIIDMLQLNGVHFLQHRVRSADYKAHGENCKAVLCEELGIDVLVDDFIGYLAQVGSPRVRLLVMPDPSCDYYAPDWKTDGSEGNFGRRNPPESKGPGRPKVPPLLHPATPCDHAWAATEVGDFECQKCHEIVAEPPRGTAGTAKGDKVPNSGDEK